MGKDQPWALVKFQYQKGIPADDRGSLGKDNKPQTQRDRLLQKLCPAFE